MDGSLVSFCFPFNVSRMSLDEGELDAEHATNLSKEIGVLQQVVM